MKIYKTKMNPCLVLAMVLASPLSFAAPDADKSENPLLDVIAADLNNDKYSDSAMLVKSGDGADFYLYLGNAAGDTELKLAKKNLVWSGAMAGTLPQLRMAKDGAFYIYSQNDAVGRNRWHQRLNIDYRDNGLVVIGYTYDERDTLDPKSASVCDVDLLTGNGMKNKTPFKIDGQKIKLSDWSDDKIPKQCRN